MSKKPKRRVAAKRAKSAPKISPAQKMAQAISKGTLRVAPGRALHEPLAKVIAKAWSDPDYRTRLLTIPHGAHDGYKITDDDRARTKKALKEMNIVLSDPVVLTPSQFATYEMASTTEVVFPLPDHHGGLASMHEVNAAMDDSLLGV